MRHTKFSFLFAVVSALVFGSGSAAADMLDKRAYLVGGLAYSFIDNDLDLEDDMGFHLAFGKPFSDHLNIELQATTWRTSEDVGSGNARLQGIGLDLMFFPDRENSPFYGLLGVMAGNMEGTIDGVPFDEDGEIIDLGLGLLVPFSSHGTAYRFEYRYRFNEIPDDGANDHVLMMALQYPLGAAPVPPPPPPPPPPPKVNVESVKPIVLRDVWFKFDSAELLPESKTKLNEVVASLKSVPKARVMLSGHTCNLGPDEYNLGLSQRRADSVKAYLVSQGIKPRRLITKGYGELYPLADNATREGREENRRVELQRYDRKTCVRPAPGDATDEKGCAKR